MDLLNSYISKERTEFKSQDEFYEKSHEVIIKRKQLEVKGISYDLTGGVSAAMHSADRY